MISISTAHFNYDVLVKTSYSSKSIGRAQCQLGCHTFVRYYPGSLLWVTILNVRVKRVRDFQTNKSSLNRDRNDDQSKHFGTVIGRKIGCYALVSPPVFTYRGRKIIISINGISRTIPVPSRTRYDERIRFESIFVRTPRNYY